jgi:SAM-dependent methyltransferase
MKVCLHCKSEFKSDGWKCPKCSFEPEFENGFLLFAPELNYTNEGFNTKGFEELYALEEKNFWFRVRNQLIAWGVKKYFPSAKNFLEIGCGTGFVLADIELRFPEINCSGSELHAAGLEFAKSRVGSAPLFQMDARNIPFRSEFGLIGAFDVLEHIKEDEEVLAQMYKAVRPGGGIILTVPQHPFLWSSADELACHERRYTAKELKIKVS